MIWRSFGKNCGGYAWHRGSIPPKAGGFLGVQGGLGHRALTNNYFWEPPKIVPLPLTKSSEQFLYDHYQLYYYIFSLTLQEHKLYLNLLIFWCCSSKFFYFRLIGFPRLSCDSIAIKCFHPAKMETLLKSLLFLSFDVIKLVSP